jgi:hypothetical protein
VSLRLGHPDECTRNGPLLLGFALAPWGPVGARFVEMALTAELPTVLRNDLGGMLAAPLTHDYTGDAL